VAPFRPFIITSDGRRYGLTTPLLLLLPTPQRNLLMDNYTIIKALGQGTWGVVQKAKHKRTGREVAIKKIKSERPEEGVNFTAVREIKLLRSGFRHENVIELVDAFTTSDKAVCLVYECASTDLSHILSNRAISISLADTKQHLLSLLRAIEFCHENWILHRDLKP